MPTEEPKKVEEKEQITPTDLEAEHAKAQRLLEEEELNESEDESEEVEEPEPEDVKEPDTPVPTAPEVPQPKADTVSDKSDKVPQKKITVKDSDGESHEFASLDEVPDDFEPETYKSWAVAVKEFALLEKEQKDTQKELEELNAKVERDEAIEKIQKEWDEEIKTLGIDKEKSDAVFEFIATELQEGRRVANFTHAFEIYEYRLSKKIEEEKKKEETETKKKAGGKVMGSGSGVVNNTSTASRTIEAPPSGVSLDDVHAKILGTL
jgi:hypothetical protein